jgi:hypothetical protein
MLGVFNLRNSKYMVVWGGEVNHQTCRSSLKAKLKFLVENYFLTSLAGFITNVVSDYQKIKGRAKSCAEHVNIRAFYPSNIVSDCRPKKVFQSEVFNVMVGVSALKRNNHLEAVDLISAFDNRYLNVFFPMSYGRVDLPYMSNVKRYARFKLKSSNVVFLEDFMKYDEYMNFLSSIDVAFFLSDHQQGLGNLNQLLACGAKIYIKKESDYKEIYDAVGVKLYDVGDLSFDVNCSVMNNNKKIIMAINGETNNINDIECFFRRVEESGD